MAAECGDVALTGTGFGLSQATYLYLHEVIDVLAARALGLPEALQPVQDEGWSHVSLDG